MLNVVNDVEIGVLKVHPRNEEFFDDISGQQYEQFKRSIQEEGIITPITVAPDMTIISGHQRYKAALDIGIRIVPVIINQELTDETKKLKTLLAANFGREKNNEVKQRKVIAEYVELCGYKQHDNQWTCQNGTTKLSLDEIATQLGTSKRDLQRALSIERNLTPAMKDLLDTGVITKTLAADVISSLSENEQEQLVSRLDATKKYTQRQIQEYVDKMRNKDNKIASLEADLQTERNNCISLRTQLDERPEKEIEVVPEDYDEIKQRIEGYKSDYKRISDSLDRAMEENSKKVKEIQELKRQIAQSNEPQEQFEKKIKDETIFFCSKIATFIKDVGGYVWLADYINEMPDYEKRSYLSAVANIKAWAENIDENIDR